MTIVSCQCGQRFRAAAHLAGRQVACPACGSSLQIPAPPKIPVQCRCGGRFQANAQLAGKAVKCPTCQQVLHVPDTANGSTELDLGTSLGAFGQDPFAAAIPAPSRIVRPAAASEDGLNRWVIASIVGGAAFVVMFIALYSTWSWISTKGEEVPEVAQGAQPAGEVTQQAAAAAPQLAGEAKESDGAAQEFKQETNAAEDAARKLAEAELARLQGIGEPSTTEELERSYQLPAGAKDSTPLWIAASDTFYADQFDADAAGIQIVDASRGYEVPPPGLRWPELARAQQLLAKYRQPLDQLHEAARNGGSARFPTHFQDGVNMEMPHLMELMATARVLRLEANVRGHQGDVAGATESVETVFALARSLETFPHFVGQLVAWSNYGHGFSALEDLLPYLKFSDTELQRMAAALDKSDADNGLYRALVGERALALQSFQTPESLLESLTAADTEEARRLTRQEAEDFARVAPYVKQRDRWALLRHMRGLIEASQQPCPQRLASADQVQRDWDALSAKSRLNKEDFDSIRDAAEADRTIIANLIVPAFTVSFDSQARFLALWELSRTAIAIERYRNRHGQPPDSLAQLASEYLSSVPLDPYSGKPIRYLHETNGYRVYSIGRNRVDDQGRGTLSGVDGDIVFAVPLLDKSKPLASAASGHPSRVSGTTGSAQPPPRSANPLARRQQFASPPIGAPVGTAFEDSAPAGGYLVGLRVIKGSNWGGAVNAIQPIYRVGNETHEGKLLGGMEDKGRQEVIAKSGYAVGGIQARRGAVIDSIKLIFYRVNGNKMDSADKYESEWLGGSGGIGVNSVELGGSYIISISGTFASDVTSLRLHAGQP